MSSTVEPMSCETALDLIDPLLDGELDAWIEEDVHRHLSACPSCSREATAARQVLTGLRSLPEFDPPPRVLEHVQRSVDRDTLFHFDPLGGRRWLGWIAAAATLVLAVGVVTIGRHHIVSNDTEAHRAAAEVTYALACVSNITQRANRAVRTEVIDHRVVPVAARGLGRPFQRLTHGISQGEPMVTSPEIRTEGNS